MALFLITYELNKLETDYPKLLDYLNSIGAHRVLYSDWLVRLNTTQDALYSDVLKRIDGNDGLLVCVVESVMGNANLHYPLSKFGVPIPKTESSCL